MSPSRGPRPDPRPPSAWTHPRLGRVLALWLLGSAAAVLAARGSLVLGLATALAAGAAFGLASARRVDRRRMRVARRARP